MNIYNLKQGEAVKLDKRLLVGLKNGTYRIDEELKDLNTARFNSDAAEYYFHNDVVIETQSGGRMQNYYRHGENILTEAEYRSGLREITAEYRDDEGYIAYPSLEVEFETKKTEQTFIKAYEKYSVRDEYIYEKLIIEIIAEAVDTGSRFIQTPLSMGQTKYIGYPCFF